MIGNNLPAQVAAADLDFGSGVTVKSIVSHTPARSWRLVDVAADAVPGKRDVVLGNAVLGRRAGGIRQGGLHQGAARSVAGAAGRR